MDNKIQPSIWNMILYKLKWILEKKRNTFKKNIYIYYLSHLVHSFLTIMPQVLINIALNVFPCNAPREIPPCMAYPSLAVLCTYCQATSIHCLQEGHLLIWPVIIHLYAGRNCIIIRGCAANHSFTRREWWKATLSQIMTYRLMPGLNSPLSSGGISISFNASRNVMRRSVLYGPIVGMWQRTPSLEMAAHMVILAPLWPGTVTVALCPMMFLPRLLTLQRLKPASSTKINLWCAPSASNSIIL